ncbi:unnamed protein product [Darwinula stevensoni]|uniref:cAMP-dependent protein kinase inhibitor beta n=1 Tax=Darwinula stevensoni TaxID=69355 RepID=A0A7R8X9A8_9CRUS|nr:unnamed protein product [Darwinula stevensoni]CAG0890480.1 unnamed protein product [Darwinula stevensoni]
MNGMETAASEGDVGQDDFLNSGRTGRRNAMPDILDEKQVGVTTADLPDKLVGLSTEPTNVTSSSSTAPLGQNQLEDLDKKQQRNPLNILKQGKP